MFLAALRISREGYYMGSYSQADPKKPLRATVQIIGQKGKTEMDLPPEVSDKIIALIADELAAETRKVAEAMTAQFVLAGSDTPQIAA